jgi:hypothetical protein
MPLPSAHSWSFSARLEFPDGAGTQVFPANPILFFDQAGSPFSSTGVFGMAVPVATGFRGITELTGRVSCVRTSSETVRVRENYGLGIGAFCEYGSTR